MIESVTEAKPLSAINWQQAAADLLNLEADYYQRLTQVSKPSALPIVLKKNYLNTSNFDILTIFLRSWISDNFTFVKCYTVPKVTVTYHGSLPDLNLKKNYRDRYHFSFSSQIQNLHFSIQNYDCSKKARKVVFMEKNVHNYSNTSVGS